MRIKTGGEKPGRFLEGFRKVSGRFLEGVSAKVDGAAMVGGWIFDQAHIHKCVYMCVYIYREREREICI